MLNWFLHLVFDEFNENIDNAVKESKLVSEVSKAFYIPGYPYKNLTLKVSQKWFLKRGDLMYVATYCS